MNPEEYQLRKKQRIFFGAFANLCKKKSLVRKRKRLWQGSLGYFCKQKKRKAGIDLRLREDFYHKYTHGIWIDG